jgi:hypothetical protein
MGYRSVESKIRDILEGLQPKSQLGKESDQNDQIAVGSYQTKTFDMSPDAQILFADLPIDTDATSAEVAAINLDKLFGIHKHIVNTNMASQSDIDTAEELVQKIKDAADGMNQPKVANIADDHFNDIKSFYKEHPNIINPEDHVHPADDPRFHSGPKGNKPDPIAGPQGDRDIDNVKNYLIRRSKAAQRKLKLIDND